MFYLLHISMRVFLILIYLSLSFQNIAKQECIVFQKVEREKTPQLGKMFHFRVKILTFVTFFYLQRPIILHNLKNIVTVDFQERGVRALEPTLRQKCPNLVPIRVFSKYLLLSFFLTAQNLKLFRKK